MVSATRNKLWSNSNVFFCFLYYFTIYVFIGYQSVKLVLQGLWILPESKVWYEVFLSIWLKCVMLCCNIIKRGNWHFPQTLQLRVKRQPAQKSNWTATAWSKTLIHARIISYISISNIKRTTLINFCKTLSFFLNAKSSCGQNCWLDATVQCCSALLLLAVNINCILKTKCE